MQLNKLLHTIFLKSPTNLFDEFIIECQKNYESPAHNLVEIKQRENKKLRGDIFEEFCVLYLKYVKKYENVWRLEDVPNDILEKLSLKRRDMGIDLIAENNGMFSAVQCKYKKPLDYKKTSITWKALSTFYALCMRSGPWEKYIIMTNCDYARHVGKKTEKDLSICVGTFRKISSEDWINMCQVVGKKLEENIIKPLSQEELKLKRLAYFDKVKEIEI
jgi:hypothetical protein